MPRAAKTPTDFAERLSLALKVLNLSRAQLAALVAVDKSLVSRWLSGQMKPTGHNLARISEALAKSKPGFNTLHWERPRGEFEAFLGIPATTEAGGAPPPSPPETQPQAAGAAARSAPASRRGLLKARAWVAPALAAAALAAAAVAVWPHIRSAEPPPAGAQANVSIAVMPFANLSGDTARDYFSDGFSVELLNTLANIPGLTTASRTDAFAFKGKTASTAEIARQLHVRYLLEGSVRDDGRRIRVTVELIDVAKGRSIWSQEYDRDLTDVLKMQDEIARTIAAQLTHRLLANAGPAPRPIEPDVYKAYLQANHYASAGTLEGLQRSIDLLREVTRREPDFADGYANLGQSYLAISVVDRRRLDQRALAEAAFTKALAIDPANGRSLAFITFLMVQEWRWREAVQYEARLEAVPGPDDMKTLAASWLFDAFVMNDALARANALLAAHRPDDHEIRQNYAWALGGIGDYEGALGQTREGLILAPHHVGLLGLQCFDSAMLGRLADARAAQARLQDLFRGKPMGEDLSLCLSALAVKNGDLKSLRALADALARQFPGDGAMGAWAIGFYYQQALDFDDALTWYRRAYDRREAALLQVPYYRPEVLSPAARTLFDDPRWKALWAQAPVQEWVTAREAYMRRAGGRG